MSIVKLNNRSVKDITAFGSITSLGSLTHIATQTASSTTSISFTSGIDNTYKEYLFILNNIHNSEADRNIFVNFSADSGSNYNVTKTTAFFEAYHSEGGSTVSGPSYHTGKDLAQSTSAQQLMNGIKGDDDSCGVGLVHLFNPSSTTFVKHFISSSQYVNNSPGSENQYVAGYCNVTAAIDAVQFSTSSGNMDSGTITLYGIS